MYMWKESGRALKVEAERLAHAGEGPIPSSQPHLTSSFLYLQQLQLIYSRGLCVKNLFILQKKPTKARTELQG